MDGVMHEDIAAGNSVSGHARLVPKRSLTDSAAKHWRGPLFADRDADKSFTLGNITAQLKPWL